MTRLSHLNIIKYIEIYLSLTVLLYFIGPITWKTDNTFLTFLLIALYQFALYIGYKKGSINTKIIRDSKFFNVNSFVQHYTIYSIVYILINTLRAIRITQLYGFHSIEDLIFTAFTSSSSIYNAEALQSAGSQMYGGSMLSLMHMLLGPITVVFIPLTIICFNQLGRRKLLAIASILIFIISQVIVGTNEGFAHIVIYIAVGLLLRQNRKTLTTAQIKIQNRKKALIMIGAVLGIIIAFNYVMSDRNGEYYNFSQLSVNRIDEHNWLLNIIPENLRVLLIWLTFYVCDGYYGMSLALNVDWTPMFGTGFSSYLRGNIEAITHTNLSEYTLMWTNSQNWPYGTVWHTAYTWFASDVSWIGVVFIMYGIGYLLAVTYKSALSQQDPISVGLFALLIFVVIFIPANNKVFSLSDTFFAFFFYLIVWIRSPKKSICYD